MYKIIRRYGGWNNWQMDILEKCHCNDVIEVHMRENFFRSLLDTENTILSTDYIDDNQCVDEPNQVGLQNGYKRVTRFCDFFAEKNTHDNSSINQQIKNNRDTKKLRMVTNGLQMGYKKSQNNQYFCDCGKEYKHRQGLWRHQQNCGFTVSNKSTETTNSSNDIKLLTNLVLDVVKQNQELTNKIVDICKTSNQTIVNGNINSNNKTFNLHFFLNETCKNAMNISDFINSLQLQLSDLEIVGKLGYVDGISNIIVKNLNALDETSRPIHCTDKKRETFYIKDEDKWEKDDDNKNKIKSVIKNVAYKNERLLPKFKELHPGCNFSESKYSDQYSKLVIESMGGLGNDNIEKEDKIIKNIAKEVTITKLK
jgi:hypothetical protein